MMNMNPSQAPRKKTVLSHRRQKGMGFFCMAAPQKFVASSKNAEFLHHNVPGMRVPESVRKRMQAAGDKGRAEGLLIATEALRAVKDRVHGAYIMPPFGRVESALEILEQL